MTKTELIRLEFNEFESSYVKTRYQKAIDQCLEYSENKKQLIELIKQLSITIEDIGTAYDHDEYREQDPKMQYMNERIVYSVIVKRNNKQIVFKFCDSYANSYDRKKWEYQGIKIPIKPSLYSILACISAEYMYQGMNFKDFCSEYGYNEDSIKDNDLYKKCLEHNKKLHEIFTDKDIECLPR